MVPCRCHGGLDVQGNLEHEKSPCKKGRGGVAS